MEQKRAPKNFWGRVLLQGKASESFLSQDFGKSYLHQGGKRVGSRKISLKDSFCIFSRKKGGFIRRQGLFAPHRFGEPPAGGFLLPPLGEVSILQSKGYLSGAPPAKTRSF